MKFIVDIMFGVVIKTDEDHRWRWKPLRTGVIEMELNIIVQSTR